MFFDVTGIVITAYAVVEQFKHDEKRFEKSIENFSDAEKKAAREKRRIEQIEERRHRELCQAIRDSKPESKSNLAAMIIGASIISGSINNE